MSILGIHHITALASDPQRNVDFYTSLLGLRLVKQTVNFDAPDVYHLYYGDEVGNPGTILTFFPFPEATRGKRGTGETTAVAFSIPCDSMEYWIDRLASNTIHFDGPSRRVDEEVLTFEDYDGMTIELIPDDSGDVTSTEKRSDVDPQYAIRKLYGATFVERHLDPTAAFLTDVLGFEFGTTFGNRHRYTVGTGRNIARIDVVVEPNMSVARQSAGSVHHIAWRVVDDGEQLMWRDKLIAAGSQVTQVMDRAYFHSIYFREPGGVLFEIATDAPGFAVDESIEELGMRLKLPKWFESRRTSIQQTLPPLRLPDHP